MANRSDSPSHPTPTDFIRQLLASDPNMTYADVVEEWEDRGYRGRPAATLYSAIKKNAKQNPTSSARAAAPLKALPAVNMPTELLVQTFDLLNESDADLEEFSCLINDFVKRVSSNRWREIEASIPFLRWDKSTY